MPKTKISEYSTTNTDNTDIGGINIAEGCAPSGINNAIREVMAQLKNFQTGASGDAFTFAGGVLMSGTPNTVSGSLVISGTATATTQSSGDNTTKLATTAFVQTALQTLYPVGSIYTNATNSTNPGTLLGFGTWTAFGAGRVMVGFNASDTLFDTAEETGGSKDAIVVSHTHTATSTVTDSGHYHIMGTAVEGNNIQYGNSGTTGIRTQNTSGTGYLAHTETKTTGVTVATTNSTEGSSGTNANLQPYITVYMWKRTA